MVEREFRTTTIHQGYIEPRNTAVHGRDVRLVWVSTQGSFDIRAQVSAVLQVPVSKVFRCRKPLFQNWLRQSRQNLTNFHRSQRKLLGLL